MTLQKKPKSRQEILKKQQQLTFVGREEHITAFRHNLAIPPADWCFLFSIWGQGGVGKSTLLQQFRRIAEAAGFLTAYTSDSDSNVLEVIGRVAEQLEQQGFRLNQFAERYKVYLQKKQELEADPDAPQGFSAFLGKSIAKAGLGFAKQIPGSGAITPFLDEDMLANQAGDWASFVAKKISNRDEVHLVQKPVEVLTPLFLHDLNKLAEQRNLLLLFDTYERTVGFLDSWLREILEGRYGDLPVNVILVIAGREELERNRWTEYEEAIARIPLEPFTQEEAKQYLNRRGITNPQIIDVILRLSGRLPLLVATLAAESPTDLSQIGNPSGAAVERFLQWVDDPKYRQVALDAALPCHLNRDVIAVLQGEESADELFNWLIQMPFVQNRPDGWAYHDIARTQMLRHKRLISPQGWAELHGKLAEYYEVLSINLKLDEEVKWRDASWQTYSLQRLYHQLCRSPQHYLDKSLNEFLAALRSQRQFAMQCAKTIIQAGREAEAVDVQRWGEQLVAGLEAYDEKQYDIAIGMFTTLLEQGKIETPWLTVALGWRGNLYQYMSCFDQALQDFDTALELADDPWIYAWRGEMYRMQGLTSQIDRQQRMELWQKAVQDLTHAIELTPNDSYANSSRGAVYRLMGCYQEALQDLNRAIELNPVNDFAISVRGATYRKLGLYPEAFQDFNRAIELDANNGYAMLHRGELHRLMQQYPEALKDLSDALELELLPINLPVVFLGRGRTYMILKRYREALSDFDRAIELDSERDWFFYYRALCFAALKQFNDATSNFAQAIQMAKQKYDKDPEDFTNSFNLGLYHLAAGNDQQMRYFYSDALHRGAPQAIIQEAIQDLEYFLKVFPNHQRSLQIQAALSKRLKDVHL